jgi:hypothetical protein
VAGEDDRCPGNHQQSPKDFLSKGDDHGLAPCSLNAPAAGR